MPHMVVFRTSEGKPGYHMAETLDDAVRFVEHLRNSQNVAESKVYRMHEVPIEFKVMYKVEVSGTGSPAQDDAGGTDAAGATEAMGGSVPPAPRRAAAAPEAGEPSRAAGGPTMSAVAAPSPVAQTGGRFGLFSRA